MRKKFLSFLVSAACFSLVSCSGGQEYDGSPEDQAAAACADAVRDYAKDPVVAEIVKPVDAQLHEADQDPVPEGAVYRSVNFGDARFITGTGAPDIYSYGCITYHDADRQLIDVKADVVDSDEVERFGYAYVCDEFYYEEPDLESADSC